MHLKKLTLIFCMLLHGVFCTEAQTHDQTVQQLRNTIINTVSDKCHLTGIMPGDFVRGIRDTLFMDLSFNNESLRTCWSPEVAVQYIHDAALSPVLNALWNLKNADFRRYRKIVFRMDIRPHDLPPLLQFEVLQHHWDAYKKDGNKARFYKQLRVSAQGEPYYFNADEAIGIE